MNNDSLTKQVRKYMQHEMIARYTELPTYPALRSRLLQLFLRESADPHEEVYALAVSLAQLGLDTHDLVEAQYLTHNEPNNRAKQLKVLAGDYYNGLFYRLLAGAGRIEAIRLVVRAIAEVNRLKVALYEKWRQLKLTAEEYWEHTVAIRSELFLPLLQFISARYATVYPELVRTLTRCELLGEEMDRCRTGEIVGGYAYLCMLQSASSEDRDKARQADKAGLKTLLHKYRIFGLLTSMLQTQLAHLKATVDQLDSETLRIEIGRMLEPFAHTVTVPKVAEEI